MNPVSLFRERAEMSTMEFKNVAESGDVVMFEVSDPLDGDLVYSLTADSLDEHVEIYDHPMNPRGYVVVIDR